ncbi:DUF2510 domain-containing protein [Pseudactinotalea terrae]|uniref:DUF2510 domain-containing protein n=1 Tax=Pseudactinotalea terrae TaxID=1743262 RepID=UPI0019D64C16|nr:DUF2510 domain-containing protein [Pseudactinotalea terrae]
MSDKAAGWYPDPDGDNRQRYWDGDSWTEYYTPLAPERTDLHGASTAVTDYPYLTASKTGSHHDLMAPPIHVGRSGSGGWPTAPAAGGDGDTQEFNGGGKHSRASAWAMVAASALVVLLVVGVAWWAFRPDSPAGGPTDGDTTRPTDGETVTAELTVDSPSSATVPAAGLWIGTLELGSDTTLLLEAYGSSSSSDLRISVVPEGSDDPVGANDDRGNFLASIGGNALNPLLAVTLAAGTYEVHVDERNGAEVDFDISATSVTAELAPGSSVDASTAQNGFWAGVLTMAADGAVTITVEGVSTTENSNPDAVVVVVGEGDRQYVNDDRNADDRDPQLEQDLPAGTWVVLVFDYRGRALEADVTVS